LGTVHYTFNYDNLMKSTTSNDGFTKLITPPRKAICIDTMLSDGLMFHSNHLKEKKFRYRAHDSPGEAPVLHLLPCNPYLSWRYRIVNSGQAVNLYVVEQPIKLYKP